MNHHISSQWATIFPTNEPCTTYRYGIQPMNHHISSQWVFIYRNRATTSPASELPHLQQMSHHISKQWGTPSPDNEPPHLPVMSHRISNQWVTTYPINGQPHLQPMSSHIANQWAATTPPTNEQPYRQQISSLLANPDYWLPHFLERNQVYFFPRRKTRLVWLFLTDGFLLRVPETIGIIPWYTILSPCILSHTDASTGIIIIITLLYLYCCILFGYNISFFPLNVTARNH